MSILIKESISSDNFSLTEDYSLVKIANTPSVSPTSSQLLTNIDTGSPRKKSTDKKGKNNKEDMVESLLAELRAV